MWWSDVCRIQSMARPIFLFFRTDLLTEEDQICVQPVSTCLQTVTSKRAPIHRKCKLQLRIESLNLRHPMWVADIQDQVYPRSRLLGVPWLLGQHNGQLPQSQATGVSIEEISVETAPSWTTLPRRTRIPYLHWWHHWLPCSCPVVLNLRLEVWVLAGPAE